MDRGIDFPVKQATLITSQTGYFGGELMKKWQLQEAKAKLSELVKLARTDGPQVITLHDKPTVVVMSKEAYDKLANKPSFLEFMRSSPFVGEELDFTRDDSLGREVDL